MPELKVSAEQAKEMVRNDNPDFKIIEQHVVDTSRRWSESWEIVLQRKSDDTFWHGGYSIGKTENQDEGPYEYEEKAIFTQVEKKELITHQWVEMKKK